MSIIIFIVILAVLVFVHELGHFTVAKSFGIRVDEFGLGFPPRLFSKKIGETVYSFNSIPFGGFVKIFGENPDEESLEGPHKERSFAKKGKWVQAAVLTAGVAGNIIFAWLLISIGFMTGLPAPMDVGSGTSVANPILTVTAVLPHSPAGVAGLKSGDALLSIESGGTIITNLSVESVQNFIAGSVGLITINYKRGKNPFSAVVKPETGIVAGRRAIGIGMDMIGTLKLPFLDALWEGAKTTGGLIGTVAIGLVGFVGSAFSGKASFSDVSGPVGIASMVGDVTALGFAYIISFAALISINLAVINLIPFPALDGGRLLMTLIEAVRRKSIKPKIANAVNTVGFAILIILMAVVTYHDIARLL